MKRKIALVMSLAMVLTAMPVNGLTAYAEDIIVEEGVEETLLPETSFEAEPVDEVTIEDVPVAVEENSDDAGLDDTVEEQEAGTEVPEISSEVAEEVPVEETAEGVEDVLSGDILSLDDEILVEEITVEETEVAEKTVEAGASGSGSINEPTEFEEIDSSKEKTYIANFSGATGQYFKFVPKVDGTYTFYSKSNNQTDPYLIVYEQSTSNVSEYLKIAYNDDGYNNEFNDFYLQLELKSNNVYYLELNDYYNVYEGENVKGTYNFVVTSISNELLTTEVTVPFGRNTTLSIIESFGNVSGMSNASYSWYKEKEITDDTDALSTESSYEVKGVQSNTSYYCMVSDGFSKRLAIFNLCISSGLVVNYKPEYEVNINKSNSGEDTYIPEKIELVVNATNTMPEDQKKITYSWYRWDNNTNKYVSIKEVDGAPNKCSLTVTKDMGRLYECIVNDGYQTEYCEFTIRFSSGLQLLTNSFNDYTVDLGSTVSMSVEAISNCDKLEYIWQKQQYDWDLDEYVSVETLSETGNVLTQVINDYARYICIVSDGYNRKEVVFEYSINQYLVAESNTSEIQVVSPGSSTILSVTASTSNLPAYGQVKYQWYDNYNVIVGATSNTYVVSNITEVKEIYCRISDAIHEENVWFRLYPRTIVDIGSITENGVMSISAPSQMNRFSFVPPVSGKYSFSFDNEDDIMYIVYDSNGNLITDNWNARLISGETYYLIVGFMNNGKIGNSSFSIRNILNCTDKLEEMESKNPTCSTRGYVWYRCNECGGEYIKYLPASHTPGAWTTTQNATCTANGLQVQTCSACGTVLGQQVIPATGHSFGGFVTTQSPNALTAGTEVRTCSNCGLQESRPIPQLAGTIKLSATKLPLQLKKTVNLNRLVTSMTEGDYVLSWKSSNSKIASVKGSKVTGKKAGKATLTVTLASGVTKNVTVTVQKGAVKTSGISNIKTKMTMKKGEKVYLKPAISPISTFDKVTYSTSNKKVATVSSKGVITAKASGSAKITVKSGSKKVVITVKVPKTAPTAITGVPTSKTLKKGKSLTLKPKLSPKGAEAKITYKSSNNKVATVNANGKITAKKKGTAVITVKAGNVKATCTITVK